MARKSIFECNSVYLLAAINPVLRIVECFTLHVHDRNLDYLWIGSHGPFLCSDCDIASVVLVTLFVFNIPAGLINNSNHNDNRGKYSNWNHSTDSVNYL